MHPKRFRGSKWSLDETKVLVDCKKDASLNGDEGGQVWQQIADDLSRILGGNFQRRSDKQCRERWDTLKKVYNRVEAYCNQTGKDHWQLNKNELKSLKLATTYHEDWYTIVKEFYRNRERQHRNDTDMPGSDIHFANTAQNPKSEPLAPDLSSGNLVRKETNGDHPEATIDSQLSIREVGNSGQGVIEKLCSILNGLMLGVVDPQPNEQKPKGDSQAKPFLDLEAHVMSTNSRGKSPSESRLAYSKEFKYGSQGVNDRLSEEKWPTSYISHEPTSSRNIPISKTEDSVQGGAWINFLASEADESGAHERAIVPFAPNHNAIRELVAESSESYSSCASRRTENYLSPASSFSSPPPVVARAEEARDSKEESSEWDQGMRQRRNSGARWVVVVATMIMIGTIGAGDEGRPGCTSYVTVVFFSKSVDCLQLQLQLPGPVGPD